MDIVGALSSFMDIVPETCSSREQVVPAMFFSAEYYHDPAPEVDSNCICHATRRCVTTELDFCEPKMIAGGESIKSERMYGMQSMVTASCSLRAPVIEVTVDPSSAAYETAVAVKKAVLLIWGRGVISTHTTRQV